MRSHACPPSTPSVMIVSIRMRRKLMIGRRTNQSLHCAVESMSVVSSELGVGTLEGWVSGGLWLLDTARRCKISPHSSKTGY